MAFGGNPAGIPGATKIQPTNWQDPNSLIRAMQGTMPDFQSGMQGGSIGFGGQGGFSGGGGGFGGSGGQGGWTMGGGGQQEGISGQGAKIGALGADAAASIANAGKQNRFNQAFGYLAGLGQSGGGSAGLQKQVPISTGPIWSPGQIQGRVNEMRGQNDATVQGQNRTAGQTLAGRGMGGSSPLLAAMGQANNLGGLMANTQGENNLRWTAAQGNAQQVLGEQTASANQNAQYNQALNQQFATQSQRRNALIAAIAGMAA